MEEQRRACLIYGENIWDKLLISVLDEIRFYLIVS
jgi:hypothetical protein